MPTKADMEATIERLKAEVESGGKTKGRINPDWVIKASVSDGVYTLIFDPKRCSDWDNPRRPTKKNGQLSNVAWIDGPRGRWISFGVNEPMIMLAQPALAVS